MKSRHRGFCYFGSHRGHEDAVVVFHASVGTHPLRPSVPVNVPQYNDNWTEPYFAVSDELSSGLTLQTVPKIAGLTVGKDYEIPDNDKLQAITKIQN
ncbi:MAG: hypothetical protein IIZ39_03780 [Blautia sp.]|nr:hypothetical protein [Blautia sp.]